MWHLATKAGDGRKTMPRQNRVDPFGRFLATPERGDFMGNRGCLHDEQQRIVRVSQVPRWLICVLSFRDRRRRLMLPGQYTHLFFLDEATALAAGHRPCFECRRVTAEEFRAAWLAGNRHLGLGPDTRLPVIDRVLHAERINREGRKMTYQAPFSDLPAGAMFELPDACGTAALFWNDRVFAWSPGGYQPHPMPETGRMVRVLTPASTVRALAAGYRPVIHVTAEVASE